MSNAEKAKELFLSGQGLSCAECVLMAFDSDESILKEADGWGHGRAPGKFCGALHAALAISGSDEARGIVEKEFLESAGDLDCRSIRKKRQTTCADCVLHAGKALENLSTD